MSTELRDGQLIFELGCGWGFLTLWMAEHFANRRITAVANANSQRKYIQQQAKLRGLDNRPVTSTIWP
ncbi:MAG: class I SAM-dependent methyltransferase [Methylococcales bacterium]|nr:class I SAM-dependent methyltransferase [Methylococcales bacterium]